MKERLRTENYVKFKGASMQKDNEKGTIDNERRLPTELIFSSFQTVDLHAFCKNQKLFFSAICV